MKIFCFRFSEYRVCLSPSRLDAEGVSRSSRHVRRGCGGRRCHVGRTWRLRTAKARGPGLPTLRSSRAVTSRATTAATKPGSRGERAISVKTIAQGMPDDLAEPVVSAASFSFCWRAMGCGQHPAFPAPSYFSGGRRFLQKLGHDVPRECGLTRSPLVES